MSFRSIASIPVIFHRFFYYHIYSLGHTEMIKSKMQKLPEGPGWSCTDCSYTTNVQTNLFSHIETHHCCVAYQCPVCLSAHPSKNSLRMHIKRKHTHV